jgi:hypothetical protein
MKKLAKSAKNVVQAGVLEPRAGEVHLGDPNTTRDAGDRPTIVDVAVFNEYGTSTAPARSFIHDPFDNNKVKYERMLSGGITHYVGAGGDKYETLKQIGAEMVKDFKQAMRNSIPPPDAEITIQRKHSTITLIASEQLINSLTWRAVGTDQGTTSELEEGGGGSPEPLAEGVGGAEEGLGELGEIAELAAI